ncbi:hypothetical protein [Ruegeria sp. EL01]|uniref:hypothetical protein n=1 Tax=Ruegeria sp. EL01 TaxID=2107578 RepID=UPI000EA82B89|nr:hypothetical protein [Ruegeria sp. EL01]
MRYLIITLGFILVANPVLAQNCAEREHVIGKLRDSYSEELRFGGLQKARGAKSVMEIWANQETGSFTVLVTHANGLSCIVAVGTNFFEVMPGDGPDGDPT